MASKCWRQQGDETAGCTAVTVAYRQIALLVCVELAPVALSALTADIQSSMIQNTAR